jgi:hypothetical protein
MNKDVTTIDGFNAFGGKDFDESLYGTMDQIHPNAKGQGILADAVFEVLQSTGGLTGMPSTPTAADGGMAGTVATDAGAVGGPGGVAAADAGTGKPTSDGGADGGVRADAGKTTSTMSDADSGSGGSRPRDSGAPADDDEEEDEQEEETDTDSAPVTASTSRDDGGCQMAGSSASSRGLVTWLLVLLCIALRGRLTITREGRGR